VALLGAAPWLSSNVRHDWWSFTGPASQRVGDVATYARHLRVFVDVHLPAMLDLRVPFTLAWPLPPLLMAGVYAALLAGVAWLGWSHRGDPVSLLVVVLVAYPLIYAVSGAAWIDDEPRYVVLLAPTIALLLAWPLRTPARAFAACAAVAALSTLSLVDMAKPGYRSRADGQAQPTRYGPLVRYLDAHRVDRVFSDYWVSYTLDFLTNERIVAGQGEMGRLVERDGRLIPGPAGGSRRPAYYRDAAASPRAALVYAASNPYATTERRRLLAAGYRRERVGQFVVYLPPTVAPRR
jgi:hypothetical protein